MAKKQYSAEFIEQIIKETQECFLQVKIPHICKIFSSGTGGEFYV
jgi:hypothetical protein